MILGNFANKYLNKLTDAEIDMYENFLAEKDWDIYAWIVGSIPLPEAHDNQVVKMIINNGLGEC
jgi:antitoxin CptB